MWLKHALKQETRNILTPFCLNAYQIIFPMRSFHVRDAQSANILQQVTFPLKILMS